MTEQLGWKIFKKPRGSEITIKLPGFCVFITSVTKVPCKILPICSNEPLEKTIDLNIRHCEIAIVQSQL